MGSSLELTYGFWFMVLKKKFEVLVEEMIPL